MKVVKLKINSYIQGVKEIKEKVDQTKFRKIPEGLSNYERDKEINKPTHFSRTLIKEGRYKGYDKVRYYREL